MLIVFGTACNAKQKQTKAHITQRRTLTDGKLMIAYTFNANGKMIVDSEAVTNEIVPHDSVPVVFSSENPNESKLQIP